MEGFINQTLISELHSIIRQEQAGFETREAALIMYTWITKAMVLSTSGIGYDMAGELMSIFSVPRLGKIAADGFNLVIGEQRDVLTKESFAVLRVRDILSLLFLSCWQVLQSIDFTNSCATFFIL